ncbi:NAD(P)H-dependent oxidoreductase [Candidatus Peribacteria bacterium]|nr:NAD(P)H-dependent oxidoreductase [Candidatus Peribacteria bacterium]
MSDFNKSMQWRYATKHFDAAKKLTKAQLDELLDAARLSASSYGLQPYKLLVITNPELRAKLCTEAAYNQPQVADASHLVIFCTRTSVDEAYVDSFVANIAKTRGVTAESLAGYRDMMAKSMSRMTTEQQQIWSQKQAYIALGTLLAAAAHAEVDACPMEGFDSTKVDEILGLKEMGLASSVFCTLGFRAADDATAEQKKVRLPRHEFIIERV